MWLPLQSLPFQCEHTAYQNNKSKNIGLFVYSNCWDDQLPCSKWGQFVLPYTNTLHNKVNQLKGSRFIHDFNPTNVKQILYSGFKYTGNNRTICM